MSFIRTAAFVAALFVVASFDGVHAGTYDDAAAKAAKSIERTTAKLAKLQACAADPKPCAEADLAKATKAADRAAKKLEAAKNNMAASN